MLGEKEREREREREREKERKREKKEFDEEAIRRKLTQTDRDKEMQVMK